MTAAEAIARALVQTSGEVEASGVLWDDLDELDQRRLTAVAEALLEHELIAPGRRLAGPPAAITSPPAPPASS